MTEEQKLFGIDKLNIKRSDIPLLPTLIILQEQNVTEKTNKLYYDLISKFEKQGTQL